MALIVRQHAPAPLEAPLLPCVSKLLSATFSVNASSNVSIMRFNNRLSILEGLPLVILALPRGSRI